MPQNDPMSVASQRQRRAIQFANFVIALVRDVIPERLLAETHEFLTEQAARQNLQIINVPPEWDGLTKLQMEKAMLETHPMWIKDFQLPGSKDEKVAQSGE